MRIVWAKNPLETLVEVDDRDKLLMRERLKTEYLEDRIVSASFELDPARRPGKTAEDRASSALQALDVDYVLDDEVRGDKTLNQWLDERVDEYVKDLLDKHCGDCTCVPASCSKCHAESMLGVDTIDGLGKHSAYKIDAAFKGDASIDEAIERLAAYRPTHDPASKWPKEDWEKHVPRWIEEAKLAHAWLVAYRDKHFAGGSR